MMIHASPKIQKLCRSLGIYAVALSFAFLQSASGQHAVRDDFPNGNKTGVIFEHFTKDEWNASNFAKPENLKTWRDRRYGMFIHFGITSKALADLSWGSINPRYAPDAPGIMATGEKRTDEWTTWPADMKLEKFNAKEWVEIAKRAGFKYLVVTTKHHEGFHMWDTAFSDFKITNTPFGRDYLKELTDACHEAGMPVGFYFAQREWYHPDYQPVDLSKVKINGNQWELNPGETSPLGPRHAKYLEYQENVIRELCTKYGKIDIWWWDAVTYGNMFTKEMWDSERMTRMIRELQPGIVINNRASLPGDFDTPECHLGDYQDWRDWETCMPISTGWCFTGDPARSFDSLVQLVVGAACGDGNLLASWGPHWDGAFDAGHKQRLFEIGDWLKSNGASIYGTRGGPWKPGAWGGSTRRDNTAYIHLFHRPSSDMVLPAIPEREVVSAKLLATGETVAFKQNSKWLTLSIPSTAPINGSQVVELTMSGSLNGLPAISRDDMECSFATDPTTFGAVVSGNAKVTSSSTSRYMPADGGASLIDAKQTNPFAVHTGEETAPFVEIDLKNPVKVTGLFIVNADSTPERMATLSASTSLDGKEWTKVWKADKQETRWQIPITEFVSGAQVPGKIARYIRLQTHPDQPNYLLLKRVEIWGK